MFCQCCDVCKIVLFWTILYLDVSVLYYSVIHWMQLNSLRPSDTIWWHRLGLTLAQVMDCYLKAPSCYWTSGNLPSKVICGIHHKSYFTRSTNEFNHYDMFGHYIPVIITTSPGVHLINFTQKSSWWCKIKVSQAYNQWCFHTDVLWKVITKYFEKMTCF